MKIAPSIQRIGTDTMVNSYLVEEAREVTIIDAGVPGYFNDSDEWTSGVAEAVPLARSAA